MSNQGSIDYTVNVDTSDQLKAEKVIDLSTKKIEKSYKKADEAVDLFNARLKDSGREINKNGQIVDKNGKVLSAATLQYKKLTEELKRTKSAMGGVDKQTNNNTKGLASFGRKTGQASIQVQQFIGQVQGGQNALVALSQQGADFGIVVGAPLAGAIFGIGASLIGMLIPSLFKSGEEAKNLTSTMEILNEVIVKSETGVNALSDSYARLAKSNAAQAQAAITIATIEATEAIKNAQAVIKDESGTLNDWTTNLDDAALALAELRKTGKDASGQLVELGKASNVLFGGGWRDLTAAVDNAGEKFGISSSKAFELVSAIIDVQKQGSPQNFAALQSTIASVTEQTGFSNKEFNEFAKLIANAAKEGENGAEKLKLLMSTLKGVETGTESTIKKIDSMISSLQEQAKAIGENTRATAIRIAMENKATEAQLSAINASFDAIEADEKRIETQKELDDQMNILFQNEIRRENERSKQKDKDIGFAEKVSARGQTPIEKLEEEQAQLLELQAQYADDSAVFEEAITRNKLEQLELRKNAEFQNASLILSASGELFGSLAGLLKNSGNEQSNAYKAMFALSKGFAIAQAGLNLSLAISNASAISPWYASIPAVAKVVSTGAGLATAIGSAVFTGGREFGGDVTAGANYRINEKGTPEVYTQGGKDFLMNAGAGGSVKQLDEISGGGGGFNGNVIIQTPPGSPMTASVSMADRDLIVKLSVSAVAEQFARGQGSIIKSAKQSTNLTTRAGK